MKRPFAATAEWRFARQARLTLVAFLTLTTAPVFAGPIAVLSIEAGPDTLLAASTQILQVEVQSGMASPKVVVTLDPSLRDPLRSLTTDHVHQTVVIRICGVVVSQPELWAPITDGIFAIRGDDLPTAKHLASVLQAKDCAQQPSS